MNHLHLITHDPHVLCIGRISGARSTHETRKREHLAGLHARLRMAMDSDAPETALSVMRRLYRYGTSVGMDGEGA